MTADEIAASVLTQPVTPLRVQKLVKLCQRMRVELTAVLEALPPEERELVKQYL